MAQWQYDAGVRRIKGRRNVRLRVVKEQRPPTNHDPFSEPYRMPMGDGHDRAESWADYLRRMTSRPGWSVARLARESGIHRATIFKWMSGRGGATVASVRAIAEALGDDPANALRAAGSMGGEAPDELDPDLKRLMRRLADPDTPEAEREFIRRALRTLAELAEQSEQAARPGRVIKRAGRRRAAG